MEKAKFNLSYFESPFFRTQVEGHLIWGFLRHFPIMYLVAAGLLAQAAFQVFQFGASRLIGLFSSHLLLAAVLIYVAPKMSRYAQAVIFWLVTKITVGTTCVLVLIAGVLVGFLRDKPYWPLFLILVLLWAPVPEFIPKLTPYQRYFTLARILITPGILWWGRSLGYW